MAPTQRTKTKVGIEVGPDRSLVRLVRLAARSLATDANFRVDDLEDLALGLDELVNVAMLAMAPDAVLRLDLEADDMGVGGKGRMQGEAKPLDVDDVTRSILDNTFDRWVIDEDGLGFDFVRLGPDVG